MGTFHPRDPAALERASNLEEKRLCWKNGHLRLVFIGHACGCRDENACAKTGCRRARTGVYKSFAEKKTRPFLARTLSPHVCGVFDKLLIFQYHPFSLPHLLSSSISFFRRFRIGVLYSHVGHTRSTRIVSFE